MFVIALLFLFFLWCQSKANSCRLFFDSGSVSCSRPNDSSSSLVPRFQAGNVIRIVESTRHVPSLARLNVSGRPRRCENVVYVSGKMVFDTSGMHTWGIGNRG
jgi:hypothetical protein